VRHVDRQHLGLAHGETGPPQRLGGLAGAIADETKDAEIGRIRDGERPQVDAGIGQNAGDLGQTPGPVLEENRYLLHCAHAHPSGRSMLGDRRVLAQSAVIDDALGLALAAGDGLGLHELHFEAEAQHGGDLLGDTPAQPLHLADRIRHEARR